MDWLLNIMNFTDSGIINKNGKKVMDIEKIIEDSKKIEELKKKPETEN